MSYTVGLTGGIGSGKSAATDRFTEHGITVVDADVIAREVVLPKTPALETITEHFGDSILTEDGELDRSTLRRIIFNNPTEKLWLENLLHPIIRKSLLEKIQQSTSAYTILSAPLLLENNLEKLVDRVLVIDCDPKLQIERTQKRDNSDPDTVKKIIDQQISREQRLSRADDVITNNGALEELKQKVDNYHSELINKLSPSHR